MPLFFIDKWYLLLVIPGLIISIWAQIRVKSTFAKYNKIGTRSGMNGKDASIAIQQINQLNIPVETVEGSLTDHYDPRTNVIRLSQTVGTVNSIAAIGVAAHETGHALQYAEGYGPIKVRAAILPTTQFATSISPWLVFAGLLFGNEYFAYLGVILFGMVMLFQLITLPVEFNASARALNSLKTQGILTGDELVGAKKVLSAAALTYIAALLVTLLSFIRLLLLVSGRGRRNR
ncbi:MAG: zinc metallopeptidase [Oscillospiraceae bacterium]|nr:zinc metallopeptidase [Oscillospiraceae bacterium]MDD3832299.1 zinc metallopeptidase [Oscillospiraceae bacterium]MDD4546094.1 zinc metallopeptidase [Oscillospiraceae bacterium]